MGRRSKLQKNLRNENTEPTVASLDQDVLGIFDQLSNSRPREIPIADIVIDPAVQVRIDGLDNNHLSTIRHVLENGGKIDTPIVVFDVEDRGFVLADGFHRVQAHIDVGELNILAEVRQGTLNDALSYAEEANLKHGLVLSNRSKQQLLLRRLQRGHAWAQLSNREIARELGVDAKTVGNWIKALEERGASVERSTRVGKDGRAINTEKIGRQPQPHLVLTAYERDEYLASIKDEFKALMHCTNQECVEDGAIGLRKAVEEVIAEMMRRVD